ncbi:MAG: polysaccharide deacetylase family protein [Acidiferrobacterales bacterium]|nr:polysaccharide deacetylase family protein [Acidiferrobacterales bacterium]
MPRAITSLALAVSMFISAGVQAAGVTVLTYHDIVTDPGKDKYGVGVKNFESQLQYLQKNHYHPISLKLFIQASQGKAILPSRAVILSFDDGLDSYRDNVVPILAKYGYPSVLSIVTGWVDGIEQPKEYRGKLLSWDQLRQLQNSSLVEIVSHSHNLHHWITSSPQDFQAPAGITHRYDTRTHTYETESAFERRIRDDLLTTRRRFRQMLGHAPLALTWPYGAYDAVTMNIAKSVGFGYQLTLDEGNAGFSELPDIRRYIVLQENSLQDFQSMLSPPVKINGGHRFVEFNLEVFAHVSPEYHVKLMNQLARRVRSLGIDTVVVTPFTADHREAFFPNSSLPVRYDLLNGLLDRLSENIAIRNVYLRIPDIKKSLPVTFFSNLAKRSSFNALVFDTVPGRNRVNTIRKSLSRYLPEVLIGSWGHWNANIDFSIVNENTNAAVPANKGKVLVFVNQENYLTVAGLSDALRLMRKQGIRNYGYSSLNYMAGPSAPDELVEAMGNSISGADK